MHGYKWPINCTRTRTADDYLYGDGQRKRKKSRSGGGTRHKKKARGVFLQTERKTNAVPCPRAGQCEGVAEMPETLRREVMWERHGEAVLRVRVQLIGHL